MLDLPYMISVFNRINDLTFLFLYSELNTSANETQDWSGEKPEETSTDAIVEPK